jgi:nitroreductase
METFEVMRKRCSLKTHLSPKEIKQEVINKIIEAACLAPSARNSQPWRFVVVTGKENVENVVTKAFFEFNRVVKEAPALILACANPSDDDIHEGREYYLYDVGMAVENMLLAATDLGLVTHPMTAVNEDELRRVLQIPDKVRFIVATPLAYPREGSYDEAAREKLSQRTRKGLKEVAYLNRWGTPA